MDWPLEEKEEKRLNSVVCQQGADLCAFSPSAKMGWISKMPPIQFVLDFTAVASIIFESIDTQIFQD